MCTHTHYFKITLNYMWIGARYKYQYIKQMPLLRPSYMPAFVLYVLGILCELSHLIPTYSIYLLQKIYALWPNPCTQVNFYRIIGLYSLQHEKIWRNQLLTVRRPGEQTSCIQGTWVGVSAPALTLHLTLGNSLILFELHFSCL